MIDNQPNWVLSQQNRINYNAVDSSNRCWSVWKIENGIAHCQASSVCGWAIAIVSYEQKIPVEHLRPFVPQTKVFVSDGHGQLFPLLPGGQLGFTFTV